MKAPHLISALAAAFLVIAALLGGTAYAESMETRYVHALAPWGDRQRTLGNALQRAAFRAPDLLPVYGASELMISSAYHASRLFQNYPTGFNVFIVGDVMVEPLILFQRLAALGSELHGKKVVITLSPDFVMSRISSRNAFAYNFSPLHSYETVFSSDLSLAWKVDAARRLVGYPETIQKYPVLNFALQNLADGSPLALVQYYAALPLGKVQCWILQLQDHWATLSYINRHPELESTVPHKTKTLKWDALLDSAQNQYDSISNNNPFGFSNDNWNTVYHGQTPPDQVGWGDQTFLGYLKKAQGWTDLALLLRALKELGAEPLVLSAPLSGAYFDFVGISPQARNVYYDKLQATVEPYDVYLLDFRDHDEDKEFLMDARFHLSGPGWVYYSETIDAFYHGTLGVGR